MKYYTDKKITNYLTELDFCILFDSKNGNSKIIKLLFHLFSPGFIFYSNTIIKSDKTLRFINTDTYYDEKNFIKNYKENSDSIKDPAVHYSQSCINPFIFEDVLDEYYSIKKYDHFFKQYEMSGVKRCLVYHYKSTTNVGTYIAIGFYNSIGIDINKYLNLLSIIAPHINKHLHNKYLLKSGYSLESLTKREVEVIKLLKKGNTQIEISNLLNITVRTVRFHLDNIVLKLKAKNKFHALSIAIELHIA